MQPSHKKLSVITEKHQTEQLALPEPDIGNFLLKPCLSPMMEDHIIECYAGLKQFERRFLRKL